DLPGWHSESEAGSHTGSAAVFPATRRWRDGRAQPGGFLGASRPSSIRLKVAVKTCALSERAPIGAGACRQSNRLRHPGRTRVFPCLVGELGAACASAAVRFWRAFAVRAAARLARAAFPVGSPGAREWF